MIGAILSAILSITLPIQDSNEIGLYSFFCFEKQIYPNNLNNYLSNNFANGSAKRSAHSHRSVLLMLSSPLPLLLGRAFKALYTANGVKSVVDNL